MTDSAPSHVLCIFKINLRRRFIWGYERSWFARPAFTKDFHGGLLRGSPVFLWAVQLPLLHVQTLDFIACYTTSVASNHGWISRQSYTDGESVTRSTEAVLSARSE